MVTKRSSKLLTIAIFSVLLAALAVLPQTMVKAAPITTSTVTFNQISSYAVASLVVGPTAPWLSSAEEYMRKTLLLAPAGSGTGPSVGKFDDIAASRAGLGIVGPSVGKFDDLAARGAGLGTGPSVGKFDDIAARNLSSSRVWVSAVEVYAQNSKNNFHKANSRR